jgi:hypothetical protein
MISTRRMAELVAKRVAAQEVTILALRLRLAAKPKRPKRGARPMMLKVSGVDFGDGKLVTAYLEIDPKTRNPLFVVHRWKSRRKWTLPGHLALGALARAAQVREASARLGPAPTTEES